MNKIALAFRSRTFWTIVVIVLINTLPQVKQYFPQGLYDVVNPVLGFLAAYFHISPSQDYGYIPFVGIHKDPESIQPPSQPVS